MKITVTGKDMFYDVVMLIAALFIVIQIDEFNYQLVWDFHGLLYAAILLTLIPAYHVMIAIHYIVRSVYKEYRDF